MSWKCEGKVLHRRRKLDLQGPLPPFYPGAGNSARLLATAFSLRSLNPAAFLNDSGHQPSSFLKKTALPRTSYSNSGERPTKPYQADRIALPALHERSVLKALIPQGQEKLPPVALPPDIESLRTQACFDCKSSDLTADFEITGR